MSGKRGALTGKMNTTYNWNRCSLRVQRTAWRGRERERPKGGGMAFVQIHTFNYMQTCIRHTMRADIACYCIFFVFVFSLRWSLSFKLSAPVDMHMWMRAHARIIFTHARWNGRIAFWYWIVPVFLIHRTICSARVYWIWRTPMIKHFSSGNWFQPMVTDYLVHSRRTKMASHVRGPPKRRPKSIRNWKRTSGTSQ